MYYISQYISDPKLAAYLNLQIILMILTYAYSIHEDGKFSFKKYFKTYIKYFLFSTLSIPLLYFSIIALQISESVNQSLKYIIYLFTLGVVNVYLSLLYKYIWTRKKDIIRIFIRMALSILSILALILFFLIIFKINISLI